MTKHFANGMAKTLKTLDTFRGEADEAQNQMYRSDYQNLHLDMVDILKRGGWEIDTNYKVKRMPL